MTVIVSVERVPEKGGKGFFYRNSYGILRKEKGRFFAAFSLIAPVKNICPPAGLFSRLSKS